MPNKIKIKEMKFQPSQVGNNTPYLPLFLIILIFFPLHFHLPPILLFAYLNIQPL